MNMRTALDVEALAHPERLPARMTADEVVQVARFSKATLQRRQKAGRFPKPVEPGIYLRDEVLPALGLSPAIGNAVDDEFQKAADAFHHDRAAAKRRAA